MYSERYWNDIKQTFGNDYLGELDKKSVLVTGATGLIGSSVVDMLLYLKLFHNYTIDIIVAGRSMEKMHKRFENYIQHLRFVLYDACEKIKFCEQADYIIHCAGNAHPAVYIKEPVETMLSNYLGIYNLLEYGRIYHTHKVIYVSSSEVYGTRPETNLFKETDYAYIDILNPRACYPSSKRASETLCAAFSKQYSINFNIVRPGHIYGPTQTEEDSRASAQFINRAIENQKIIMKSAGNQLRSYCHSFDCAFAILTVAVKGRDGEAYNISNSNSIITIKNFAEICAEYSGTEIEFNIPSDSEKQGYTMMSTSALDSGKLEELGWRGVWDARFGIKETIELLKEFKKL